MRKLMTVFAVLVILSVSGTGHPVETKLPVPKSGAAPAAPAADVFLRFSKHEGISRIVFETADESFIKNTTVTSERNQIKVLFPSNLNLKAQGNPDMETSLKGNLYTITVNSPFRIKVLKLSSPPRLSVDIMAAAKDEGRKPAAVEATGPAITPNIRVVLDPGHGGYEVGIVSGDLREKDLTFSLARSVEAALLKKNKTVFLTRKADQFLSITDRAIFANQKAPDVFISLHLSMTDNFVIYISAAEPASPDAAGELYGLMSRQRRYADKSKALAEGLGNVLKEELKRDIILRKMDLPLLASVGAASVMVELPVTVASDQSVKTKITESLLKGIASYAGQ
ncbi:MAG: N-acetylmuramoyl-L-alanine amidase [Nitrospirae bacterium]|nr:N-acetylmuramoyl-L-alanine amidase [Nitrospirota bacterium]MCL5421380.1 N-acetylmuramoyl-L-alanine amidase [Nitrospirota bacterium]